MDSTASGAPSPLVAQFFSMAGPMIAGCLPACALAFGVLHVQLSVVTTGVLFALAVTGAMTAPMAAWMRYGMRHSWRCTIEMSGLMFLPLGALIPYAEGWIPGRLLCPVICSGMFSLMLVDLLFRREMYSNPPGRLGWPVPAVAAR